MSSVGRMKIAERVRVEAFVCTRFCVKCVHHLCNGVVTCSFRKTGGKIKRRGNWSEEHIRLAGIHVKTKHCNCVLEASVVKSQTCPKPNRC